MNDVEGYLSSDQVMKVGLRGYKESTKVNWHGVIIDVDYFLTIEEEGLIIGSILNCCAREDEAGDEYIEPQLVDQAIRTHIIAAYAHVAIPNDLEKQHRLVYCSDLYDVVLKNANQAQINNIIAVVKSYM